MDVEVDDMLQTFLLIDEFESQRGCIDSSEAVFDDSVRNTRSLRRYQKPKLRNLGLHVLVAALKIHVNFSVS